jgi:hypothetical protein
VGAVHDLELAVGDDVEPVARLAGPDDDLPGRDVDPRQPARDMLFRHDREWLEHRDGGHELEPGRRGHLVVDLCQPPPGQDRHQRQDRADDPEGRPRAERVDDHGRDDRAERDGGHHQPPDDAEHAAEDVVGDDALEQRESRDILDAVGGPDDRQQE